MALVRHYRLQQSLLYLLTALAVGYSIYTQFSYLADSAQTPHGVLFAPYSVELLGVAILLLASVVTLWRQRVGAVLAIFGSGLATGVYFLFICAFAPYLFAAFLTIIFWSYLIWGIIVPVLLLALSFVYSRRVRSIRGTPPQVLHWIWVSHIGSRATAIVLAIVILVGTTLNGAAETVLRVETLTYRIELHDEGYSPQRPYQVGLNFLDHPCWYFITQSPDLHAYTLSLNDPIVPLVLEERFQLNGLWTYQILQVGQWNGSAEFHSQLVQSSNGPVCGDSPLRSPYTFIPNQSPSP